MDTASLIDLLVAGAPRQEFQRFVEAAEETGNPAAGDLRRQLPLALQVWESMQHMRSREARLAALYATANDLTGIRDLQEILQMIVQRARRLLGTDIAYLGLTVPEEAAVYVRVTDGAVSAAFRNIRLPLGAGLLGLVASDGVPYATPDYHQDLRFQHRRYVDEAVADESIRAILGVPMRVGGRVIGALLAANRTPRPFPAEEVELLSTFAAHAAIALENARLFSETAQAAEQLQAHAASAERAALVHDQLTESILGGADIGDVADVLAVALDASVQVLGPSGIPLTGPVDAIPQDATELTQYVEASLRRGRLVTAGPGRYLATATAGEDHLGTVVVTRDRDLDEFERRTVERSAVGVALLLLFARSVADAAGRARQDLLDDLIEGSDPVRVVDRARAQQLDLEAPHILCVVAATSAVRRSALAALSDYASGNAGIAALRNEEIVVYVPGDRLDRVAAAVRARVKPIDPAGTVGASRSCTHRGAIPAAYAEARQCLTTLLALGRQGQWAGPDELGFARLLVGAGGPAEVSGFIETTIGPLVEYDRQRGTELVETLRRWCDSGGSGARAAESMHVHVNTVTQRLDRIAVLLGRDWREPDRLLDVQLALRLRQLQQADPAIGSAVTT